VPLIEHLIATSKTLLTNIARQRLGASLQYRADHRPAPYAESGLFAIQVFVLKYFELVAQKLNRLMKAINVMGAWASHY
jgi:hypothetical protein